VALETFLDYHHVPICVEFDGSKAEHLFCASVPGMKLVDLGKGGPSVLVACSTTAAASISVLARELEGKMLQDDNNVRSVQFPKVMDGSSLVKKLEPNTDAEMLTLQYVTEIATRMVVHFSIRREAYDSRWVATIGASLVDLEQQRMMPVSVGNEYPLAALKVMARQLSGSLLSGKGREFRAPVMPSVQLTIQESILARKFGDKWGSLAGDHVEVSTSPLLHPDIDSDHEAGPAASDGQHRRTGQYGHDPHAKHTANPHQK
jgi:hypothetical protein